jgi:predicted dehydrogenase
MLIASLASGKHVLCEKPMATSLDGCRMMRRVIDGSDRVVLFGLQLRYAGRYRDLYQQIKAGKIGRPRFLSLLEYRGDWNDTNVWQYKDPRSGKEMNWRFSQAATGGTLNEKACHFLDLLNWMAGGLPERISCQGGVNVYRGRETWDHATVHLTYPGDMKAVHAMCLYGPPRVDLQIIGEEGSLQLLPEHILFQKRGARDAEQIALTPEVGHVERQMGQSSTLETAVLRMYEDFLDCVKRKKKPVVTPDLALIASKMAFLAERSSQRQRELPWERGFGGTE